MPLVPPYIESLRPYEAGRSIEEVQREFGLTRVSKLASNENPLGPSPLALEAMTRSLNQLHLYPNGGLDLRRVLAETVRPEDRKRHRGQRLGRHHVQHHSHVPVR